MNIAFYKVRGGLPLQRRAHFERMLRLAQKQCGLDDCPGTLQVVLLPRAQMVEMNGLHLKHEGATDVITYDLRDDRPVTEMAIDDVVAEIYVCPEVAVEYACAHGLDPSRELALYAVHGMLHLSGQDDIEDDDRTEMRRKEAAAMAALQEQGVDFTGFLNVADGK